MFNQLRFGYYDYTQLIIGLPLLFISVIALYYLAKVKTDHENFILAKKDQTVIDAFSRKVRVIYNPWMEFIETLLIIHGVILILTGLYNSYMIYTAIYYLGFDLFTYLSVYFYPVLYCLVGLVQVNYILKLSRFRKSNQ